MQNIKGYNSTFNSWVDKNYIIQMSEYFPKAKSFGTNVKLDIKSDVDNLKNVPSNFRNLKSKADKLGVGKLVLVPVDLSKLMMQ